MNVRFYENNGGGICAIVKDDSGEYVNFVPGFEQDRIPVNELFCAALEGLESAYDYDPDSYGGISLRDMCGYTEADGGALIAEISDDEICLHIKDMGVAGKILFGLR